MLQSTLMALKLVTLKEIVREINQQQFMQLRLAGNKSDHASNIRKCVRYHLTNGKDDVVKSIVNLVNRHYGSEALKFYQNNVYCVHRLSKEQRSQIGIEPRNNDAPGQSVRIRVSAAPRTTIDTTNMRFKNSPFYNLLERLAVPAVCAPVANSRSSAKFHINFNETQKSLLEQPVGADQRPVYQIRFFCAAYTNVRGVVKHGTLEMEFPTICELKVNDKSISGSTLRGLRNKPGTVTPPDLTHMCRTDQTNTIELVYANTSKTYIAQVGIVKHESVQILVERMNDNKKLPKETVLQKLKERNQDADIVMESETVSTKCPLSFLRIATPCRSSFCQHLQCFDAFSFLSMNEQTPTWSCPVCFRQIESFEELVVDGYFADLLSQVHEDVESIRIEPTGQIRQIGERIIETGEERKSTKRKHSEVDIMKLNNGVMVIEDSDDDVNAARYEAGSSVPRSKIQKCQAEAGIPARSKNSTVIDLTLDSEDEDDPKNNLENSILSTSSTENMKDSKYPGDQPDLSNVGTTHEISLDTGFPNSSLFTPTDGAVISNHIHPLNPGAAVPPAQTLSWSQSGSRPPLSPGPQSWMPQYPIIPQTLPISPSTEKRFIIPRLDLISSPLSASIQQPECSTNALLNFPPSSAA
ncbi:SUMO ligase siz1 [Apophysomyces sp. BC1034]|nr:SUMO ligase siz1 [Apophysomyces sp. BC1015]KAG0188789.1 SUMO ligase siz1 [Apophysomyces sp. BC1034]